MCKKLSIIPVLLLISSIAAGQGQDSATWERDLQVIATMLPGRFANANQAYFDVRGDKAVKHGSFSVTVEAIDDSTSNAFLATIERAGEDAPRYERWLLEPDSGAAAVRMRMWQVDGPDDVERDVATCDVHWHREAAQFRAVAAGDCIAGFANEFVLSSQQFWIAYPASSASDYRMHRAREFECYADIPGVGGGRDEPYQRYGGFPVHDQGGSVWFTSSGGQRLGISLFLVDWPINNYEGIFTRDSLVVYVNEEVDGERKQHGYAFTLPEADRVGINLKWILVNCYMESNEVATPSM